MAEQDSGREADFKPSSNLRCPRCHSFETKFYYYNNYKKSQPRYLCKTCKRLWTEGGNVRDIPSKEGEGGLKRASGSSSGEIDSDPSSVVVFMGSGEGNLGRVGTLNLTRPAANRPQLKFTSVDINNLSLAGGQNHVVEANHHDFQGGYGQDSVTAVEPSDHL